MTRIFTVSKKNISSLENGVYIARWYGYTFELEDGRIFDTDPIGVRQSKRFAQFHKYSVHNGRIAKIVGRNFSYKRTALFTQYYQADDLIVSIASKNKITLYGGTGLQYLCRFAKINFYRERSVDDLDFTCDYTNRKGLQEFAREILGLGYKLKSYKGLDKYVYRFTPKDFEYPISIDLTYHTKPLDKNQILNINGDLVWSPLIMFVTKLERYGEMDFLADIDLSFTKDGNKLEKDKFDLATIYLISKKLGISKSKIIDYISKYPYLEEKNKIKGIEVIEDFDKGLIKFDNYKGNRNYRK